MAKDEENQDKNKAKKVSPMLPDGKIDVSTKYGLGGQVLNQEAIDRLVKKYKKKE